MADKLIFIPNDDTQNSLFCKLQLLKRLDTQLHESANQNSLKVPKVDKSTNKKTWLKTLGTSVINSPLSPFLPEINYDSPPHLAMLLLIV